MRTAFEIGFEKTALMSVRRVPVAQPKRLKVTPITPKAPGGMPPAGWNLGGRAKEVGANTLRGAVSVGRGVGGHLLRNWKPYAFGGSALGLGLVGSKLKDSINDTMDTAVNAKNTYGNVALNYQR